MKPLLLTLALLLPATAIAADPTIAAGASASFVIEKDGTAFGWGYNGGQFGVPSPAVIEKPTPLHSGIRTISTGTGHTLYLDSNGDAFGTGYAARGQLGIGMEGVFDDIYKSSLIKITGDVKALAGGVIHTIILKNDGSAWTCGDDSSGQLGLGQPADAQFTPVKVMTGIQAIAAGGGNSLFLTTGGVVWGAGANESGQLGDGTRTRRTTPIRIMGQVRAISAGQDHSLFLKTDGSVWAVGANRFGQLGTAGDGPITSPVRVTTGAKAIFAGSENSFYIKSNGDLWATGSNNSGQLGDGTTGDRHKPVRVLTGVAEVASRGTHTIVRKKDGSVWTTGGNYYWQLGHSGRIDKSSFAAVHKFTKSGQPEIVVRQPENISLKDGSARKNFGTLPVGQNSPRIFTIRNTGTKSLTGIKITINGPHARDFTFTKPDATVPPGDFTTFTVTFKPAKPGTRTAALHIRSNDKDENPFDIKLTGLGKK
ncbi:choice-of-anchor D domain-containing protein [Luteolibacter yonseiensis]|uniref:Choice-of-anchor D domain-containing protein n=1 Tax=Luteolibacter yonseiensis TaxID=1144680 RepID=A0A934V6I8_9BACT|nr:choice-of-anchor D domain-containing protein [Luteolibacter yonseiensis]MBK1815077.1 choice-of-anchor D domain-containing protein [Luteolibacter yonseiensis]